MGRHNSNTVTYFPHYIGDGKKIFSIERKYGNDGYATWFKLLEKLATTENHFLDLNDEGELFYLSAKCNVSEDLLNDIIVDLVKLNVFNKELWESKIIYSETFINSIADAYKRRNQKYMTFDYLCKHLSQLGLHKSISKVKNVIKSTQSRVEEIKVEESNYSFFDFWELYPKKTGKKKSELKWNSIKEIDKEKIKITLPFFIEYLPFPTYNHPDPLTYLNGERWNDDLPNMSQKTELNEPQEDIADEIRRIRGF